MNSNDPMVQKESSFLSEIVQASGRKPSGLLSMPEMLSGLPGGRGDGSASKPGSSAHPVWQPGKGPWFEDHLDLRFLLYLQCSVSK